MVICGTTEPPVWSGDEGLPTHRLIHEIGGSADFLQTNVRSEEEVDRAIMTSVATTPHHQLQISTLRISASVEILGSRRTHVKPTVEICAVAF